MASRRFVAASRPWEVFLAIAFFAATVILHQLLTDPLDDPQLHPNRHDTPNFMVAHFQGHLLGTLANVLVAKGLLEIAGTNDKKEKKGQ